MAAPTASARGTPTGIPLKRGFRTQITLACNTTINFWEKKIKPPGIDGGDKISTTTMFNTTWRTFTSRGLLEMTDITGSASYDPGVTTAIQQSINRETTITIQFEDGTKWFFYGFLKSFEPQELSEDANQPECQVTFVVTNWDYTNNIEAGPGLTNVTGT